jgi:HEAT repeat protein
MHTAKLSSLLKNLGHPDASKRRAAAEALAEGDERAVYPLIKALKDDNYGVQDAAINSLIKIREEVTAYMVLPLLREEAYLRNTALIILREMGHIALPLLPILLKDKDDDIRKFALDIIHDIQYCNYPEKLVEMLANDPNPNVRAAAAKTIGVLNYTDAVPQLVNALHDEEWVCFSVLEALTELKAENSVDSIIILLSNSSETVRLAAIEALGKIGSQKACQPLLEHIAKSDGFEKQATLINLVRIGTVPSVPNAPDDLMDVLMNGDWDEKFVAIKGLLILKEDRAIYPMIDIAGSIDFAAPDRDEKVQTIKEAVISFGCNDHLLNILEDDTMKYRGKSLAIEIAGDLQCKSAVKSLVRLIKSNYRDIRRSSIYSLGQIDGEEATEYLIEAINDHDSHVRKSAVIALGKIGEMSAFEPLMKLLNREIYQDVINEFITALLNINAPLFLSRIDEFSEPVRMIASKHASTYGPEVSC